MSNEIFVVLEVVDMGDHIVSIHKSLFNANYVYNKLVDEYPYSTSYPEDRYWIQAIDLEP